MQASILRSILVSCVAVLAWAIAPAAWADPPARIARLSYTTGAVSFSPALDPDNWAQPSVNRPFFIGDRLWTDADARAELEFGTAVLHAAPRTSVTVLNIDESITQIEVAEGRLNVRVRTLENGESFEIDTPNLAFAITRPGTYLVDVDPQGDSTIVAVRDGHGEVYGEGRSYIVDRGQWYRFYGTALDNDYARIPVADEFDRWALGRNARHDRSVSARYVPRTMIGYEDLDAYGSWSVVADYGNVWIPRSVPANWAPYRNGHWTWIDPWGWTWVDEAPWGFAPFHYGRWTRVQDRWGWVPGPTNVRPVYAPALVAFVGGSNFSVSVGGTSSRGVAWFPLAPGEVYRPSYQVSREYFTQVNVTNTRVNTTVITNIYNSPDAVREVRYRHREPAAVTAVAMNTFVESRPVARAAVPVRQITQTVQAAPVVVAPVVAPARASVIGAAGPARVKPPEAVTRRQVVARTPPPQATPAFTPTQAAGGAAPETNTLRETNRARAPRERVRVVTTAGQPATPAATAEHRGRPEGTPPRAGSAAAAGAPGATPAPGTAIATPTPEAGAKGTANGAAAARGDRGPARAPATAAGSPTAPSSTGAAPPAGSPPATGQPPGRATPEERDARGNGRANGRDRGADRPGAPAVNPAPPAAAPSTPAPAPATNVPDAGRSPGAGKGPDANRDSGGRGAQREAPQRTPEAPPATQPPRVPAPAATAPAEGTAGAPAGRNNGRGRGRDEAPAATPARPAAPAAAPAAEAPPASPAQAEPRQRGNGRGRAPEAAPQPPAAAPAAPAPRSAEPPAAARPEAGARRAPPAATPAPVPTQAAPVAPPRAAPPVAPAAPAATPAPAARPQPPAAAPAKGPGAQPSAPPGAPADADRGQGRGKDDKGDEQRRREKEKGKDKDKND